MVCLGCHNIPMLHKWSTTLDPTNYEFSTVSAKSHLPCGRALDLSGARGCFIWITLIKIEPHHRKLINVECPHVRLRTCAMAVTSIFGYHIINRTIRWGDYNCASCDKPGPWKKVLPSIWVPYHCSNERAQLAIAHSISLSGVNFQGYFPTQG